MRTVLLQANKTRGESDDASGGESMTTETTVSTMVLAAELEGAKQKIATYQHVLKTLNDKLGEREREHKESNRT